MNSLTESGDDYIEDDLQEEDDWNDDTDADNETTRSSFACEDCDYRWEDYYDEDLGESLPACPMCGTLTVTQI